MQRLQIFEGLYEFTTKKTEMVGQASFYSRIWNSVHREKWRCYRFCQTKSWWLKHWKWHYTKLDIKGRAKLQEMFFDISLRCRKHRITMAADIEKMYWQILAKQSYYPLRLLKIWTNKLNERYYKDYDKKVDSPKLKLLWGREMLSLLCFANSHLLIS